MTYLGVRGGYVCTVAFIYCSFWSKDCMLQDAWVMCALLLLYIVVFGVRTVCCRMLGLCVHCWVYIL